MKYSATNPRQPLTLIGNDESTYLRVKPYTVVDSKLGISEGPLYAREGVTDRVFQPELAFQVGVSKDKPIMNPINLEGKERVDFSGKWPTLVPV